MKYQYHDLSDSQFEKLVINICQEILGLGTTGFARGKDGGRDALFHGTSQQYKSRQDLWDGKIVIQAKHTNGLNEKFSDPSFSKNQSSIIMKEIPRIKSLFENGDLDYYMLFSNRKLTGQAQIDITKLISNEVGIAEKNIALFGIDNIEEYLKRYPCIQKRVQLDPFDYPIMIDPEDLAEIIVEFAMNFKSEIKQNKNRKEINRVRFDEKNRTTNLSDGYAKIILKEMSQYFDDISDFLSHPENSACKELYESFIDEFNLRITVFKNQSDREDQAFDLVLNYFIDILKKRDSDLKANKKLTRIFVHYMYFYCDIGIEYEFNANKTLSS